MEGEPKKISFGFSKLLKKSTVKPPEEKKQFIDCLEGKSIKVIGGDITEEKKPLIIPLKEKDRTTTASVLARIARGEVDIASAENGTPDITEAEPCTEPVPGDSLDKMAEREILEDLKKETKKQANNTNLVVPVADNIKLTGEKESTLEDYENIPVSDFGMAMLRGMGWQPGKGMGKHCKSSELVLPNLRPKGMGLGADKVSSIMLKKENINNKGGDEDLKIIKGAYVKIVAGKQSGTYGQISGFDEDSGRLIVKTAIGGGNINLSEFMVQAIAKDEYQKMSKVINAAKYEEYKIKETLNSNDQEKRKGSDPHSKTNYENDKMKESKYTSRDHEISDRDHNERKHKDSHTNINNSKKYSVEQPSSDRHSSKHSEKDDRRDKYVKLKSHSTSSSPEPRRDVDKKRKGKKKRRDRSRSREHRRH